MADQDPRSVLRAPVAGFLAWVLPGLGHIYLGHRGRGLTLLVAVSVTFWAGVAMGGAPNTVDPHGRRLWFAAQIFNGGHTLAAYAITRATASRQPEVPTSALAAHWRSSDIGAHYTGVAGLLNLLIILDAIGRADAPAPRPKRVRARAGP